MLPFSMLWLFSKLRFESKEVRLKLALEELGPIYIKLGQLLSSRRDFLDPLLADELASLQDNVPPYKTPPIESIILKALNIDPAQAFSHLDTEPFASASIAQVYAATLHSGEEVVIKIVRPGIEKVVKSDIKILKWLAKLIENNTEVGEKTAPYRNHQ